MATKTNYLQNAELLREIHKSKVTYCSYLNREDADYDVIISSFDEVTPENMEKWAQEKQDAHRRTLRSAYIKKHKKRHGKDYDAIQGDPVDPADLVYRLMTWDHIPDLPEGVTKPKDKKRILPFPPFKHFKLVDGEFVEVCRSHWQGGIQNGWFSEDHGKLTNNLGQAFMLLVKRYGRRGNWRGYTYNDEMQAEGLVALCNGALKFDESRSSNPFAYYTVTVQNAFTKVLNAEKKQANTKDDLRESAGIMPSSSRQSDNAGYGRA